ncbi:unnamed protein product [Chironomus riparius]|uniref:Uncharacterized protein n=1 Tax=Chironomus riparius TaxID=315576 RepID=A0A9N9SAD7_9DIPT|nr:unnamed protein product [Chironomus riparius]
MKLTCTFEDFIFNNGEKFYQCIIKDQEVPQNSKFEFSGQHLPKKYDPDVTFVEFRDCNCPKVPQGLTKAFPNLKVLSICNSKLKDISKDDMAEYKNLHKFICHKNEVDFLPGELFEGFEDLTYIKFTGNKLGEIEPNLLDELYSLDYVNFNGNIHISHFYASNMIYNPNALLGEIQTKLIQNFLNLEAEKIRAYISNSRDPQKTLTTFRKYSNDRYNIADANKVKMLEISANINDEKRAKELEQLKSSKERLMLKVQELKESNAKMVKQIEELENLELKLNNQIEELRKELKNKKQEKEKLQKNLQKQIENLAVQIQTVMLKNE